MNVEAASDRAGVPEKKVSILDFFLYFLRLGTAGFGGPVALANHIRVDLVEKRRWLTEEEYEEGLAISTACPGPLAYQLAVYCAYLHHGVPGGLAVAVGFAFTPFFLVILAAALYTTYSATWELRALFYGIGPVVIALILKASWNLGRKTLRKDAAAWIFFVTSFLITVIVEKELAALFLVAGVLGVFVFGSRRTSAIPAPRPARNQSTMGAILAGGASMAGANLNTSLFLFFFKTGLLVFGSGLVIVPFLRTYVVNQYHWLGNREFLDAVAIGMISPGPVVITATFVGFLLNGFWGGLAATIGIFTPPVLFTLFATPLLRRFRNNTRLQGFIRGITVAVVGVLAGTTVLVGKTAIGDFFTAAVGAVCLFVLFRWKKVPDPVLVLAGALLGLAAYHFFQPQWLLK